MTPTGSQSESAIETGLGARPQELLDTMSGLTLEDRQQIVDQAVILSERLYAHLPPKRAMHAIDSALGAL